MGYYTYFNLNWDDDNFEIPADFEGLNYAFDKEGCSTDGVKWYDYEEDMRALSEIYPEILFTLSGEGDEADDLWKAYFKEGKMQREYARIIYDPYDENKLK